MAHPLDTQSTLCHPDLYNQPHSSSFELQRGMIWVVGPCVEAIALSAGRDDIPSECIENRKRRDSADSHHITLLTRAELDAVLRNTQLSPTGLLQQLSQTCKLDWVNVGLGTVSRGDDRTYFNVVLWPGGEAFREKYSLEPHDFHVTVGFKGHDIHGVHKGVLSLIRPRRIPYLSLVVAQILCRLVDGELKALNEAPCHFRERCEAALRVLSYAVDWMSGAGKQEDKSADDSKRETSWRTEVSIRDLRCRVYGYLKRFSECIEEAECIIAMCPHSSTGYARKAAAEFHLQNYEAALKCAEVPRTSSRCCDPRQRVFVDTCIDGIRASVKLPRNFSWVVPGALSGMSLPKHADAVHALMSLNIRLIVTIFETPLPASVLENTAMESLFFPVANCAAPTVEQVDRFLQRAEEVITHGSAVVVHCGGGKGRAGTFLSCYMLKHGLEKPQTAFARDKGVLMSATDALQTLRMMRPGSVETTAQEEIVKGYAQLLWRRHAAAQEALSGVGSSADLERVVMQPVDTPAGVNNGKCESTVSPSSEVHCIESDRTLEDKYPSTPHLFFSPEVRDDDSVLTVATCSQFLRTEVVVTEKLDGGNCCFYRGHVFARTHSHDATHASFGPIKAMFSNISRFVPGDIALYGENMTAVHSIEYDQLEDFFYLFGVHHDTRGWLAWDETVSISQQLGLHVVPVLYRGQFHSLADMQKWMDDRAICPSSVDADVTPEGFVIRSAGQFASSRFAESVAKYVRKGHIQTDAAWLQCWKKAAIGTKPSCPPVYSQCSSTSSQASNSSAAVQPERGCADPQKQQKQGRNKVVKASTSKIVSLRGKQLIILVGLPGAGKSTFANCLVASCPALWSRVSQDELGSRSACEAFFQKKIKSPHKKVILDRCNVTVSDRKWWCALAMADPKDVVVVWFDFALDVCADRVQSRQSHPTLKPGPSVSKIIGSHAKQFQPPSQSEGFGEIVRLASPQDVDNLLLRFHSKTVSEWLSEIKSDTEADSSVSVQT